MKVIIIDFWGLLSFLYREEDDLQRYSKRMGGDKSSFLLLFHVS
jgi:hypothetical protein